MHDLISLESEGKIRIVRFNDSLDSYNVIPVEKKLLSLIDENPELIAFDFGGLKGIDSTSIVSIVSVNRKALSKGVPIVIFNINETIETILKIVNISKIIPVYSKEEFENKYLKKS